MKKKLLWLVMVAMVLLLWSCQVGAVPLMWGSNTESDLAGYRVYRGDVSGTYSMVSDVGNQTYYNDMVSADGITYFWVITAYDTSGNESGYSNEISKNVNTIPPLAPGVLRFGTP